MAHLLNSIAAKQGKDPQWKTVNSASKKIVGNSSAVNEAESQNGSSFVDDSVRTRSTSSNSWMALEEEFETEIPDEEAKDHNVQQAIDYVNGPRQEA